MHQSEPHKNATQQYEKRDFSVSLQRDTMALPLKKICHLDVQQAPHLPQLQDQTAKKHGADDSGWAARLTE